MIINMNGAKAPETPSSVLQEKTVTPETLPTVIGADEGYDGLSQVTVNPDAQLIPTNIRSGKTVFGVEGTFAGNGNMTDLESKMLALFRGDKSVGTFRLSEFQEFFTDYERWDDICPYTFPNKVIIDVDVTDPMFSNVCDPMKTTVPMEVEFEDYTPAIHFVNFKSCYIVRFAYSTVARYSSCQFDEDIVIPEGVTKLHSGIISSCAKYHNQPITVTVPSTVTNMNTVSFGSYLANCVVVMKPTTPPTLETNYSNYVSKIIVPQGMLETYQTANKWSTYASIMEEATE